MPSGHWWTRWWCARPAPAELYVVQDPAAKLQPDEVVEVVRYVVRDWKEAAAR
jgi:hypothetical protein